MKKNNIKNCFFLFFSLPWYGFINELFKSYFNHNQNLIKKLSSILMFFVLGMSINVSNGFASCDGNNYISCGVGDTVDLINSANENCCGGDNIIITDCNTGEDSTYQVPTNGPESSCIGGWKTIFS